MDGAIDTEGEMENLISSQSHISTSDFELAVAFFYIYKESL